jgi:hypothetical protein
VTEDVGEEIEKLEDWKIGLESWKVRRLESWKVEVERGSSNHHHKFPEIAAVDELGIGLIGIDEGWREVDFFIYIPFELIPKHLTVKHFHKINLLLKLSPPEIDVPMHLMVL